MNWQSKCLYGKEGNHFCGIHEKHCIEKAEPFFFETWNLRKLDYLYSSFCQSLLEGAGVGNINSVELLAACPEHTEQAPLARESLQQRIIDAGAWKCFRQAGKC